MRLVLEFTKACVVELIDLIVFVVAGSHVTTVKAKKSRAKKSPGVSN
jgi:hypothetical protein